MRNRHVGALLAVAAVLVASSGCATIASGTSQAIRFDSDPPGAFVQFGHFSGTTPVTLRIPKGKNFPVEMSHGSDKRLVKMNKTVDPMTFLNFIPPLWPGFIVDAVTGAMMKYEAEVVHLNFNTNEYQLTRSRN